TTSVLIAAANAPGARPAWSPGGRPGAAGSVVALDDRAGPQPVQRAAVRALHFTGVDDVEEDARVRRPVRHLRVRAMNGKILAIDLDDAGALCGSGHAEDSRQIGDSQPAYFELRPPTMSKK